VREVTSNLPKEELAKFGYRLVLRTVTHTKTRNNTGSLLRTATHTKTVNNTGNFGTRTNNTQRKKAGSSIDIGRANTTGVDESEGQSLEVFYLYC
jgi:hypothetical protein